MNEDFISFGPNVKNSIHVFDHTIKPILLYGSEVWGYFNPFKKSIMLLLNCRVHQATVQRHVKMN
jgi:hypothetical protein